MADAVRAGAFQAHGPIKEAEMLVMSLVEGEHISSVAALTAASAPTLVLVLTTLGGGPLTISVSTATLFKDVAAGRTPES